MVFPSAVIPQLEKEKDPSLHLDIHQISWFGVRAACLFLTEYHIILNCIENESISNINEPGTVSGKVAYLLPIFFS